MASLAPLDRYGRATFHLSLADHEGDVQNSSYAEP